MPRVVRLESPHTHPVRGEAAMEKPSKTVFMNDGQTKVTLIGRWFFMTGPEIKKDYKERLSAGDPICTRINDVLWDIYEKQAAEEG